MHLKYVEIVTVKHCSFAVWTCNKMVEQHTWNHAYHSAGRGRGTRSPQPWVSCRATAFHLGRPQACQKARGLSELQLVLCLVFCTPNGCRDTIPPPVESTNKVGFSVGIRWLGGRSLHTTRSIARLFVRVVFNVSSRMISMVSGMLFYHFIACPHSKGAMFDS